MTAMLKRESAAPSFPGARIKTIRFLRVLTVVLALLGANAALAQVDPATPDAEHVATIKRMLRSFNMQPLLAQALSNATAKIRETGTEFANLVADEMSRITPEDAEDRISAIYARLIPPEHARTLAAFFASSAGRKIAARMTAADGTPPPRFTQAEINSLNDFEKTPAASSWIEASKLAQPAIRQSMQEWGKELIAARIKRDSAAAAIVANANPVIRQARPVFQRIFDRIRQEEQQLNNAIDKLGTDSLLAPERLVSAEKIREGLAKVAELDRRTETFFTNVAAIQKEMRVEIGAIDVPEDVRSELIARLEAGMARGFDLQLRYAENQRTLINLFRQVLTFAEKNLGTIRLEDGQLVFQSTDDLDTYRSLIAQTGHAANEEQNLLREGRAARQRAEEIMDSYAAGPSDPKPAVALSSAVDVTGAVAETAENVPVAGKRRQKFVTARTAGPIFSVYVNRLLERISRQLPAEFPENAPGNPRKEIVVTISVLATGRVEKITVNHPTGNPLVDDAVVKLIQRLGPFEAFTEEMKKDTDVLLITSSL